jgi:hypothetical protein
MEYSNVLHWSSGHYVLSPFPSRAPEGLVQELVKQNLITKMCTTTSKLWGPWPQDYMASTFLPCYNTRMVLSYMYPGSWPMLDYSSFWQLASIKWWQGWGFCRDIGTIASPLLCPLRNYSTHNPPFHVCHQLPIQFQLQNQGVWQTLVTPEIDIVHSLQTCRGINYHPTCDRMWNKHAWYFQSGPTLLVSEKKLNTSSR